MSKHPMIVRPAMFDKRIFTPRSCAAAIRDLLRHYADLPHAMRGRRIERSLIEKILLTVTAVNRCRYCQAVHTSLAVRAGVGGDEVERILAHDFGSLSPDEASVLLFVQSYAERVGAGDPDAARELVATYGGEGVRDILAYVRAIMFANLLGNTFDAMLSRFRGQPAPNSTLAAEAAVLALGAAAALGLAVLSAGSLAVSFLSTGLATRRPERTRS